MKLTPDQIIAITIFVVIGIAFIVNVVLVPPPNNNNVEREASAYRKLSSYKNKETN